MKRTQFQLRLSIDIEAYPKVITGARLLPLTMLLELFWHE
jgi:hypothetical protein